jgi:GT2 family glycosyltransferase
MKYRARRVVVRGLVGGKVMVAIANTNATPADVCAVICTRDRPDMLRRALGSLLAQTVAPGTIMVVDNAPSDDRARNLVREEFSVVRYVREPIPGLNFARNRALAAASEQIVAFLDDDAVADGRWVAATEAVFQESERIALCTGKVGPLSLETEGQRLFEANGGFGRGNERIHLPRDAGRGLRGVRVPLIAWSISVGSGCSLAVRRETVLEFRGFDEALDMGQALPGGGDLDMIWRVMSAGYEVVYEPSVRAWHEHRREASATVQQILEHNRALVATLTKAAAAAPMRRRPPILAFLLWRLVKPGVRLTRRVLGRDPLPAMVLLGLWWSSWRGLRAYPAAKRLARERASGVAHSGTHEPRSNPTT